MTTPKDPPAAATDPPPARDPRVPVALLLLATLGLGATLVALTENRPLALLVVLLAVLAGGLVALAARRAASAGLAELARRVGSLGAVGGPWEPTPPQHPPHPLYDPRALDALLDQRDAQLKERLARLIDTRATLRAILAAIDAPVIATDEQGLIVLVNRACERLFHRRAGRLTGVNIEEVFSDAQLLALHARARGGIAGRADIALSVDAVRRVFEVAATPARMAIADLPASATPRAGVVLTLRDVTEIAQTVQLKTDFVANASHELRTPIASLRVAVETLQSAGRGDEAMHARLLAMIEGNVLRLEEMIADLLDLSHLESADQPVQKRPTPFSTVADSVRGLFETACRARRVTLAFDADPSLENLESDARLLHLILRNLVDNAVKFSHEGGTVTVEARATDHDPRAHHDPVAPDDHDPARRRGLRLRVIDTGIGIPIKHQARIFERFYQVDSSRQRQPARRGTGLGLAIVKHATRRLGGEVAVQSVWQQGTTMIVDLPRCVRDPALRDDREQAPSPRPSA